MELKPMNDMQKRVFGLIPRGDERPIPVPDLARVLNIEARHVNTIVYELVTQFGIPIGSYREPHRNGLFIPLNEEQRNSGIATQREQVKSQINKLRIIRNADLNTVFDYEAYYPETKQHKFLIPYSQTAFDFEDDYEEIPAG